MGRIKGYFVIAINLFLISLFFTRVVYASDVAPLPGDGPVGRGIMIYIAIIAVILVISFFTVNKVKNKKSDAQ